MAGSRPGLQVVSAPALAPGRLAARLHGVNGRRGRRDGGPNGVQVYVPRNNARDYPSTLPSVAGHRSTTDPREAWSATCCMSGTPLQDAGSQQLETDVKYTLKAPVRLW